MYLIARLKTNSDPWSYITSPKFCSVTIISKVKFFRFIMECEWTFPQTVGTQVYHDRCLVFRCSSVQQSVHCCAGVKYCSVDESWTDIKQQNHKQMGKSSWCHGLSIDPEIALLKDSIQIFLDLIPLVLLWCVKNKKFFIIIFITYFLLL